MKFWDLRGWVLCAVLLLWPLLPAYGARPPVLLEQTYLVTTEGSAGVQVSYELRVQNPGDQTLYGVVLVPDPLNAGQTNAITVGDLGPKAQASFLVTVTRKGMPSERELQVTPLIWQVRWTDAAGTAARLATTSRPLEGTQR